MSSMVNYIVYVPLDPTWSHLTPFCLPQDAYVEDLRQEIWRCGEFEHCFDNSQVVLLKCGIVLMNALRSACFNTVLDWLRDVKNTDTMQMRPADLLNTHFPTGPANEDKRRIDIVAVTHAMLETIRQPRPSTPSRDTPRQSKDETQNQVDEFLGRYDGKLREYLAGPPWKDFWKAPSSVDPETKSFIDGLEIPSISGTPALALHDLGKGVVDEGLVDRLFMDVSRYLDNTSGSGKTRLLFEGLIKHWGFYFTAFSDSTSHKLGSGDLMLAINEHIPNSHRFTRYSNMPLWDEARFRNGQIAERRLHQVLTARILVFDHFLKAARDACPDCPINEFKKHWLFFQLRSIDIVTADVFVDLSELLRDATDEYLMITSAKSPSVKRTLTDLQCRHGLDKQFYFVLDEAQVAVEKLDNCFDSHISNASVHFPVLRPIIKSWLTTGFPIIISGTGQSIDNIVENVFAITAFKKFLHINAIGGFDTAESQRKYIMRYMPPHVARSEAGEEFLARVWNLVRGRPQFTASLVTQLLMDSFRSPPKVLKSFIEAACGFTTSDGAFFSDGEENIGIHVRGIRPFNFCAIDNNSDWLDLLSDILYKWLIRRKVTPLDLDEIQTLVKLGLARFPQPTSREALVNEPLVLLAVTRELWDAQRFLKKGHFTKRLAGATGRAEHFEDFDAYCLALAFNGERRLCDVFDFGTHAPRWAQSCAQVVSLVWKDGEVEANRFHLTDFVGATTSIGCECSTVEETMEWFEAASAPICFPDDDMGPDMMLFVRLETGPILVILIQNEWRRMDYPTTRSVRRQVNGTLEPLDFYGGHQEWADQKYADAKCNIVEAFARLNGPGISIASDDWLKDGMPVLRVIASYPFAFERTARPYVSLKMDLCEGLIDQKDLLNAVASSLVKEAAEDRDDFAETRN